MKNYICKTCGVQFEQTLHAPDHCPVCEDERQYVNWKGQQWTTLQELSADHRNTFTMEERNLISIHTQPDFAIAQRAFLIRSSGENILWDCISLIDDQTVDEINKLGGLSAVALSHPHFYSSMVEWSRAFGNIPIYVHTADQQWVMRSDVHIVYWEGTQKKLNEEVTLIRCGGHFDGSAVLHWKAGCNDRGALLTGDTLKVTPDRRHVSFMYSYPNQIPLPEKAIRGILEAVQPFDFGCVYGAWPGEMIKPNAKQAIQESARRYISAISGK